MIILHGDDSNRSYQRLQILTNVFKQKGLEVISFDSTELNITDLRQELSSTQLFGSSKCIVIKNLLGSSKTKNLQKIIDVLNNETNHEIVIWENKKITISALKKLPKGKIEDFTISPVIFKFLDSLKPNNTNAILLSWKKLQQDGIEPEFVFAMVVRQIKLLIQSINGSSFLKLAPYPKQLINRQAKYFDLNHLLDLYKRLYEIDEKIKTGVGSNSINNLLTNFFQKI